MTTDIVERYLEAVAAQLPAAEREDIVAELRDLILSRVEAREEELGRALEEAEIEAILREVGHPLVVAARYRKGPDSLIGPELFPYWLFGMKAGLIILAVVQGLLFLLGLKGGPDNFGQDIAQAFHGFFLNGLILMGGLTLAGAIMEHYRIKPRWMTHWRVADLGLFGMADPAAWTGAAKGEVKTDTAKSAPKPQRVKRPRLKMPSRSSVVSEALLSLIGGTIFTLWWIGVVNFPGVNLSYHGALLEPSTIWASLYWPILGWALAVMVVDIATLWRPSAIRLRSALTIPVAIGGLWLGVMLYEGRHWATLVVSDAQASIMVPPPHLLDYTSIHALSGGGRDLAEVALFMSSMLSWILAVIMLTLVFEILRHGWRLVSNRQG